MAEEGHGGVKQELPNITEFNALVYWDKNH